MNSTGKLGDKLLVRLFKSKSFYANKDAEVGIVEIADGEHWLARPSIGDDRVQGQRYITVYRFWIWSPTLGLKFVEGCKDKPLLEAIRDVCAQNNWDVPTHIVGSQRKKFDDCTAKDRNVHLIYRIVPLQRTMIQDLCVNIKLAM